MEPLIARHQPEIERLCRKHHVRRLELFGSAAGPGFDPERSDVDFLVEFTLEPGVDAFADYFDLREALVALLGRPVDLVMPSAIRNRFVRDAIDRQRVLLYAA